MADLSGYTAWTEVHGAEAAATLVQTYIGLVEQSLQGESSMLERIGDQVVIISSNPNDIARTAVTLYKNAAAQHHFLPVHAGIHYGEVFRQNGQLFGSVINFCSRLASRAKEGKILCSTDFVYALSDRSIYHFLVRGKAQFKNIFEAAEVVELVPDRSQKSNPKFIDPVCHMQLDKNERMYRYMRKNEVRHFCSVHCMNVFQEMSSRTSLS
jgi:class 3 adenylate cyclase